LRQFGDIRAKLTGICAKLTEGGHSMASRKKASNSVKSTVKKRTLNVGSTRKASGDAFSNQDAKRRMGNFESAGEHSRVGGRGSGIVGQTTKRFRTENRKKK
jgi:hypothetical protein